MPTNRTNSAKRNSRKRRQSSISALSAISFLTAALLVLPNSSNAGIEEAESLERIVARVGAYPILVSELASQVQLLAMQSGYQPKSEEDLQRFQESVLKQLVNEKLFLIAAQQDTTMIITVEEVEEQLDQQISQISGRFPTEEEFIEALASEGLTLRELRRKFYTEVENRLLKDRFIQRKLSGISVTRQEVAEFYQQYQDSIPDQPAGVRIAHILLSYASSSETLDSIQDLANSVRSEAAGGADFETLAGKHSAPPAGDLGYLRRSDVTPEFGDAVFNLQPNAISGVVHTPAGLHILKVTNRDADSARVSQIYFPVIATPNDSANALARAQSLKDDILSEKLSFAEAAKEHSADDNTRRSEGELGWYAYEELPEEFAGHILPGMQVNEVIGPLSSPFGVHLARIVETSEAKKIDLESSYDQIREMARRQKTDEKIDEWIELQKLTTFVEIRPVFQQ